MYFTHDQSLLLQNTARAQHVQLQMINSFIYIGKYIQVSLALLFP